MAATAKVTWGNFWKFRRAELLRWERKATQERVASTSNVTLPAAKRAPIRFTPEEQAAWAEAIKSEALRAQPEEPVLCGAWDCGKPLVEAREFFRMVKRNGHTNEELRADIRIDPVTVADMERWKESNPKIASRLERMIRHRQKVLALFDELVRKPPQLS